MATPKNKNIYNIPNINSEMRKCHLQASNPSKTFSKCTNALSLKSAASSSIVP